MSKKFKNKEEFDRWIGEHAPKTVDEMMKGKTENDYIAELIAEGYTDLDDLTEDGHDYLIGGHTNHGWIYRDEADINYIRANGLHTKIREREITDIKEIRKFTGLSRTDFYKIYGIPPRTLEDWENGKHKCPSYVCALLWRCVKEDMDKLRNH